MAEIDWKEARRYLGLHRPGGVVDERLEEALRACGAELEAAARPRAVWRRFPLTVEEGRTVCAGMDIPSATAAAEGLRGGPISSPPPWGAETDRLLRRAAVTDMSRAVILQACAASLLEAYCDACCDGLSREAAPEGLFLRPRFSPGYGDFPIAFQRPLLEALEAPKRIGLTATAALMLTPTKSVTAIVGLSPSPWCPPAGCAACGKADCAFRRV